MKSRKPSQNAQETLQEASGFELKYDDTKLDEGRPINRFDLDEAAPENPVVVDTVRATGVYNSMALAMAGVTAETPDPDDGRFYRDDNGVLTGLVRKSS